MAKEQEESIEQLDKALTEIDVLESSDRNVFRVDSETFRLQKADYKLIEDYKEAFDLEMMEERFTDYLLKYDYIVGDIGYDKLRLRGFYEDHRKGVPLDMKISNLEDYLVEYCNFGCPYFVFERVEKKKTDPESYYKRNKKSNQRQHKQKSKQQNKLSQAKRHKQKNKKQTNKNKHKHHNKNKQKDFQVVKKEATENKKSETSKTQENKTKQQVQPKKKETNKQFKIRKKKD